MGQHHHALRNSYPTVREIFMAPPTITNIEEPASEIFFVFLGKKLPKYTSGAIALASKTGKAKLHLLGNQSLEKQLPNLPMNFTSIESFYDNEGFSRASLRVMYPHKFRDGFWLKTLERLFVLEQFMRATNRNSLFHAELDQLLFNVDDLIRNLNFTENSGIFVPFHNEDLPIASVLYCNEVGALTSLLDLATEGDIFANEMELIAKWAHSHPSKLFGLPSMSDVLGLSTRPPGVQVLSLEQVGGVVDPADIGHWIAGNDTRNVPRSESPSNKFVNSYSKSELGHDALSSFHFDWDASQSRLTVSTTGIDPVTVYNAHLHSKIHNWLAGSESRLEKLIQWANAEGKTTIPGTRWSQLSSIATAKFRRLYTNPSIVYYKLRTSGYRIFGYRPSSSPYLSEDSFRSIADHIWEAPNFRLNPESVSPGDVIFCEAAAVSSLKNKILDQVDSSVVLILGESDGDQTADIQILTVHDNVRHVFASNLEVPAQKATLLPVGLENKRSGKNGSTKPFRRYHIDQRRTSISDRRMRIMWSLDVNLNFEEGEKAANALLQSPAADKVQPESVKMQMELLKTYGFIACPPGFGADTHQMWEALYLDCVPVVKRTFSTVTLKELGLPLLIVDSFRDCINLTEPQLQEKYQLLRPDFSTQALWLPYWRNEFRSKFD